MVQPAFKQIRSSRLGAVSALIDEHQKREDIVTQLERSPYQLMLQGNSYNVGAD